MGSILDGQEACCRSGGDSYSPTLAMSLGHPVNGKGKTMAENSGVNNVDGEDGDRRSPWYVVGTRGEREDRCR